MSPSRRATPAAKPTPIERHGPTADDDPTDPPAAPRRGRGRPALVRATPLTLADILAAAHEMVRRDGLEACNMRALAESLGVTPSALYNHVGSKTELLQLLVRKVWAEVVASVDAEAENVVEWLVRSNIQIRESWLANLELAPLALAVEEPDATFLANNQIMTAIVESAGFADVPAAYNAILTFTMGSVAVVAGRRTASRYFGLDPDDVLDRARRQLDEIDAAPNLRGVTEARFDDKEAELFEAGLRAVIAGFLAAGAGPDG